MKPFFSLYTLLLILSAMSNAKPTIAYTLSMSAPQSHLFEVEIRLTGLDAGPVDLHMPAWRTGRYVLLDFAGGVQEFSAEDERHNALPSRKTDKDTWRIEKGKEKSIIARYKVYANEFNMRTRELNSDHAFVDPLSVFMYIEELTHLPLRLAVQPYGNWKVTTGLEEVTGEPNTYTAPNFEYFGDCPLEIGTQKDFEFYVDGKKHIISMYGEGNWNVDTLITDFTKIIIANKEFWGDLPYDKYVFFIHCQPNAGGGTEHINSTVMGVRPFIFSNPAAYRGFLGLVSHEYFHTWNVKQLRPKAIAPYNFSKENYTEELWVSEGTTSYYDDLFLVRTQFSDARRYVEIISHMVNNDRSRYGNTIQPLAEASFDAWIKYWRGRQNAHNAQSDYYGKGSHVSLLLDLEIRQRTKNSSSLDEVLKTMYQNFPRTKGFTNADLQSTCEKIAGGSFKEFFNQYVYGTAPLPWDQNLQYAGLEITSKENMQKVSLGIQTNDDDHKTRVTAVTPDSPAQRAGIEIYDEIVALNGFRVRSAEFTERIGSMDAGASITLTLFRNDKLKEISLTLENFGKPGYTVKKVPKPSELQQKIFTDWLRSPW